MDFSDHLPLIRALHIISVIAWMAGMLYLPRLYVYHADAPVGSDKSETFKLMERRLLRGIVNPAMILTLLFGVAMVLTPGVIDWSAWWVHAKGTLLVLMFAMHGLFSRWRRDFAADRNCRSARFYKIFNEVPAVLMIGIVLLAVLKPS